MLTLALTTATACTGDPEAPATVGPTAGPGPEPSYEPSTFPYESTVELTDADREQIDELLLLIDEYTEYTSGSTEYHSSGVQKLEPHLAKDLFKDLKSHQKEMIDKGHGAIGEVVISTSLIDRYSASKDAEIWVCFDYSNYRRESDMQSSSATQGTGHQERLHLYTVNMIDDNWVIQSDSFYDSTCNEIRLETSDE
ncbi:hypothetical protein [Brevibacterium album]|uniref:hypothetical protein n=1 Tax=Brevibacterium album TaxID=417948 RepID=UPI000490ECDF|nr:hypothetical protein [Brevibacterium album]